MTCRILIIEDDEELQELYATMLSGTACQIVRAYDGEEALAKLAEGTPDLIILDILLDEMMGDEVFARIKAEPLYLDIPIVVASVLAPERCRHLLDMDPRTVFLRKPFRRDDLVAVVEKGLALRSDEFESQRS